MEPLKIYLSHNYGAMKLVEADAQVIKSHFHDRVKIVSSWHQAPAKPTQYENAVQDFEDVKACDVFVLYMEQQGPIPGRGKYSELGMAIALNKYVVLIGPWRQQNECVFYALRDQQFGSITELISYFQGSSGNFNFNSAMKGTKNV